MRSTKNPGVGWSVLFLVLLTASHCDAVVEPTPLILIPSFYGTLLYHDDTPLYLAPQTPSTYARLHDLLRHPSTLALSDPNNTFLSVEYPTSTCAPFPHSHIGHCMPLPARGPVASLLDHMRTLGYTPSENLFFLPYDWRHPAAAHLRGSFAHALTRLLESHPRAVLVAHGTACHLATRFLLAHVALRPRVARLVCLAPVPASLARDALSSGRGILTAGRVHVRADAAANLRDAARVDFSAMQFELGLVARRHAALPDVRGAWDVNDSFVSSAHERIALARSFGSLREYAEGIALGVEGVECLCVWGGGVEMRFEGNSVDGDGVVVGDHACRGFVGEVSGVQAAHFDLVALVGHALLSGVNSKVQRKTEAETRSRV